MLRKLLLAIVTLIGLGVAGYLVYGLVMAKPTAPAVTVTTLSGQQVTLNQPGRPVLVNFWATTCPGCIAEMPHLAEMKHRLGDAFDIVAIAMAYDPLDQVKKFIAAHHYPFLYAHDADGGLAQSFGGVSLTPTSYLISPDGRIVYFKIGEVEYERVERLVRTLQSQK